MGIPGATTGPLDRYSQLDSTQTVVIATVTAFHNRVASFAGGGGRLRPRLSLNVENVLWGDWRDEYEVFGSNTFVPCGDGRSWCTFVGNKRNWILDGDRVLLLLKLYGDAWVEKTSARVYQVLDQWFLPRGELTDATPLFEVSEFTVDWEKVGENGAGQPFEAMVSAACAKHADSGKTLGDILSRLPRRVGK
jgi:hypothetical protein